MCARGHDVHSWPHRALRVHDNIMTVMMSSSRPTCCASSAPSPLGRTEWRLLTSCTLCVHTISKRVCALRLATMSGPRRVVGSGVGPAKSKVGRRVGKSPKLGGGWQSWAVGNEVPKFVCKFQNAPLGTAPTVHREALRRQAHPWLPLLWMASTMAAAAVGDHHTTHGL